MLSIKNITDLLVQRFNLYAKNNSYSKELAIFENFAAAENDYKIINTDEIVTAKQYGIIRHQNLQIGTVGGLHMISGSLTVDILVEISEETDEGQFPEVTELVNLINGFAIQYNKSYINAVADGSNYAIMPAFSAATVGFYSEDSSNFGAYVPVSFTMAFTALQDGTSASSFRLEIDGTPIYCETMVFNRVKTSSSDVKAAEKNGIARVADDTSAFEVEFTAPYQRDNDVCDTILAEMLEGKTNVPHLVEIYRQHNDLIFTYVGQYMMTFAKMTMTVTSGSLVGLNANLLEIDGNIAEVTDEKWTRIECTAEGGEGGVRPPISGSYVIFWGDGACTYHTFASGSEVGATHKYEHDGTYTVMCFRKD